jgi:cardiolipin synthase
MQPSQIPNIITVIRILLVAPAAWLLWSGAYREALFVMTIASASDALDGWLARQFSWQSRFGAAMDPVADKLLIGAMLVVFTLQGYIPLWAAIIVLGRDVIILGGAGVYRLLFGQIEFAPTFVSKANTTMQIVMLLLLLLALCEFEFISALAVLLVDPYCFWILAVLGVGSGTDYVITWGLRAWHQVRPSS